MMTFTYVALISGIVSWNLPGEADSMFNRLSVSVHPPSIAPGPAGSLSASY